MMVKTWTGTVQLFGEATRSSPSPGVKVTVRIAASGGNAGSPHPCENQPSLTVDRQDGLDGVGQPRWVKLEPQEIMPESLCRALAETAK